MSIRKIRIPRLHDHHSHPLFYSSFGQGVSLEKVKTKEEANELLTQASCGTNGITVAHGWRSNHFQWSADELESLPAVAIFNVSLHELLLNSEGKAQLLEKYGSSTNKIENREWYEANLRVVLNWFANLNASAEGLSRFFEELEKVGVDSAEEMLLVDENEIQVFEEAGLSDRTKFWAAPDTYRGLSDKAKSQVHGLKLFTDGALGARTAAITRPYVAEDDNRGMLIYSDAELGRAIAECFEAKDLLAIHAIGDRAIEQVIQSIEQIGIAKRSNKLVRIEHAQLISRNQASRAKALGICLSMQPNFSCDSKDYSDRMDSDFCQANNPFRMLIDDVGFIPGEDMIFGSDGMPHGVGFALTQSLFPTIDCQKLTLDEFKAGYCVPESEACEIELSIDDSNETVCLMDES